MTWQWCHSQEAYDNAYENLHECDREFLEICFAEIKAARCRGNGRWEFSQERYESEYLPLAKTLTNDVLADAIWDFASNKLRDCDNGGHNAYMCPFHCHEVPFERARYSHDSALVEDAREVAELYQQPEFERDV